VATYYYFFYFFYAMTIQQLEYIIAVDNYRHFAKAAEACRVTQPTLSMMIQKLEDELGVKIFDRLIHPLVPTETGEKILRQARTSIYSLSQIKEVVNNERNLITGEFKIGIIPTVATFIVPEMINEVDKSENDVSIIIKETPTSVILESLTNGTLDGGIAATPLNNPMFTEIPIYYEKFYAYLSPEHPLYNEAEVDVKKIDIQDLWLLEDIHCMSNQVLSICHRKIEDRHLRAGKYEAGSIATLINIIDYNGGMTIIPEMSAMGLSEDKQDNLRKLKGTSKVREISLVVNKDFVRLKLANIIIEMIRNFIPKSMLDPELKKFTVDIIL